MTENKQQPILKDQNNSFSNQKSPHRQITQRDQQLRNSINKASANKNQNNHKLQDSQQNSQGKDQNSNSNNQQANFNPEGSDQNQQEQHQRSSSNDDQKSSDQQDRAQDSNQKSDDKDDEEERSDEDMKKQQPSGKKCFNKLCNSKKIYKKLRSKVEHAKYRFFCRQCYDSYYNNDFCQFCEQIYSSTANSDDDDQWIGCDSCSRWNHIECQKKCRNKDINDIKDQNTQYLCLTCSYKLKDKPKNNLQVRQSLKKESTQEQQKFTKQNIEINRDQRIHIFTKKLQNLPSLEYFLQNYNFRLWINQNLIKDDLESLRESSKKNYEEAKKNKKVKAE